MVAKITFPKRIAAALNYNEAKVQKGVVVCLFATNYLQDAGNMNFHQKREGFERLNALNDRATAKTVHVSINFSPTDTLTESRLLHIASAYMERIGFGKQPYLVYQHRDAGHPHLHIVSTAIRSDGSRINTHNIGRNQSETARGKSNLVPVWSRQPDAVAVRLAPSRLMRKSDSRQGRNKAIHRRYGEHRFQPVQIRLPARIQCGTEAVQRRRRQGKTDAFTGRGN